MPTPLRDAVDAHLRELALHGEMAHAALYGVTDGARGRVMDTLARAAADRRPPLLAWPDVRYLVGETMDMWGWNVRDGASSYLSSVATTADEGFLAAASRAGAYLGTAEDIERVALSKAYADLVAQRVAGKAKSDVLAASFQGTTKAHDQARVAKEINQILGTPNSLQSGRAVSETKRMYDTSAQQIVNAVHMSRIDQMQKLVPGLRRRWVCGASRVHRAGHAALCGKSIPAGEKFRLRGGDGKVYLVDGPHDGSLPASEFMGCNCRVVPDLPGWPSNWVFAVQDRARGIVQLQPQW